MKKEQNLKELVDKDSNIIDFKARKALATGDGGGENWLEELEIGSIFLARQRAKAGHPIDPMNRLMLNAYLLQDRRQVTSNLIWKMPDNKQMDIWVPTLEFSRNMELVEVLMVVEFELKDETEEE